MSDPMRRHHSGWPYHHGMLLRIAHALAVALATNPPNKGTWQAIKIVALTALIVAGIYVLCGPGWALIGGGVAGLILEGLSELDTAMRAQQALAAAPGENTA